MAPSIYADDPDPDTTPTAPVPVPNPTSVPWWRNVAERAVRQALQVAAPILAAVVASGNGLDWKGAIGALVVTVALSVAKSVAGITADTAAPVLLQIGDRALAAFAATLLGFLPVDWLDWASVDWGKVFAAAVAAAVLAVIHFYLAPPAFAVQRSHALAA